jgi:hypothetical protein
MNPETRFSSQWIVARQGAGKTNLLTWMIGQDLQRDCSIIVMDSKGQLTDAVRKLALGNRLIVIDPSEYTLALNPFDVSKGDHVTSQLGYMLSGLLETTLLLNSVCSLKRSLTPFSPSRTKVCPSCGTS